MKKNLLDTVLIALLTFSIYLLGILLGLLISQSPKIKYDINGDGKVTLSDAVRIVNYYIETRNNEELNY